MIAQVSLSDPVSGRDSRAVAHTNRTVILEVGARVRSELPQVRSWLAKNAEFAQARRVNFFYEMQSALGEELGFEYYRTTVAPEDEVAFFAAAERHLVALEGSAALQEIPYLTEILADGNQTWIRDFVQQFVLARLESDCAAAGRDLVVVLYDPARDGLLRSRERLVRHFEAPVADSEVRDFGLIGYPAGIPDPTEQSILFLVEDSGSRVNLTSALAIIEALAQGGVQVVVATRSTVVVDALVERGGTEFRVTQDDALRSGRSGSHWTRLRSSCKSCLDWCLQRLPETVVSRLSGLFHLALVNPLFAVVAFLRGLVRRWQAVRPETYGIEFMSRTGQQDALRRFALRLPYSLQAIGRRTIANLTYFTRIVARLGIRDCIAVGEGNVASILVHLGKIGVSTSGVVPILISDHPDQREWPAARHFVYGDQARDVLTRAGVPESAIEVVGSEHFDRCKRRIADKTTDMARFFADFPQAVGSRVVCLATEALPGQVENIRETFYGLMQIPGIFTVLKLHPDDDHAVFANLMRPGDEDKAVVVKDYPIGTLINSSELLIASFSNVMVEAAAVGVPSLGCSFMAPGASLNFADEGLCLAAASPADVRRMAERVLFDEETRAGAKAMLDNIRRFNGPNDGCSATRIARRFLADQVRAG